MVAAYHDCDGPDAGRVTTSPLCFSTWYYLVLFA
jgi:hypothetical protein